MRVFLGGTVNESNWRDYVMPRLKIGYFNPVVEVWNDEAYERELYEREKCTFCLYVITPRLTGYYSFAEVIDDSFKRPKKTIYCYLHKDDQYKFSKQQIESLESLGRHIKENHGTWLQSLDEVINFLNSNVKSKIS